MPPPHALRSRALTGPPSLSPVAGRRSSALRLDGLTIEYDGRVLRPRPWTVAQGRWAAEVAAGVPEGPMLELCSGVGHIGLVAAARSGRTLVQVDADAHAARFARRNAARAGLGGQVDVRVAPMAHALGTDERFPLVLADPPYLRTRDIARFPEDPPVAIDGGRDGLDLVRECLHVIERVLVPGGSALVQVGGPTQAVAARRLLPASLGAVESRHYGPDRAVVLLRRPVRPGGRQMDR